MNRKINEKPRLEPGADLINNRLAGGLANQKTVSNYTRKINFSQSLTRSQIERRHAVLDCLIFLQENRQIVFRGQKIKSVFGSQTSFPGLYEEERSVVEDAEYLREAQVFQDVPFHLYRELKRRGEDDLISRLTFRRAVPIPGEITNALICEELQRRFSAEDLELCGIFVKIRDFVDGKICEVFRLDVENHLSRRGFFLPIENDLGFITGLKVYRHIDDERPFPLRARFNLIDYTGEGYGLA